MRKTKETSLFLVLLFAKTFFLFFFFSYSTMSGAEQALVWKHEEIVWPEGGPLQLGRSFQCVCGEPKGLSHIVQCQTALFDMRKNILVMNKSRDTASEMLRHSGLKKIPEMDYPPPVICPPLPPKTGYALGQSVPKLYSGKGTGTEKIEEWIDKQERSFFSGVAPTHAACAWMQPLHRGTDLEPTKLDWKPERVPRDNFVVTGLSWIPAPVYGLRVLRSAFQRDPSRSGAFDIWDRSYMPLCPQSNLSILAATPDKIEAGNLGPVLETPCHSKWKKAKVYPVYSAHLVKMLLRFDAKEKAQDPQGFMPLVHETPERKEWLDKLRAEIVEEDRVMALASQAIKTEDEKKASPQESLLAQLFFDLTSSNDSDAEGGGSEEDQKLASVPVKDEQDSSEGDDEEEYFDEAESSPPSKRAKVENKTGKSTGGKPKAGKGKSPQQVTRRLSRH
jgi:hypothetical protein